MGAKHTPGPWEVYLDNRVVANRHHAGMHGALQDHIADLRSSNAPEANARLIAAAPELFERVKQRLAGCQCMHGIEQGDMDGDTFFDQNACPDCINDRAAIAKAEGK